jgi:hypothetical protein
MATWKKVIVSGSSISQLTNDAGYIASIGGGILSGSSAGTAQGQFKLNGVDVSAKDLSTTSNVTFAQVTGSLKGNVVGNVTGNLTGAVTGNASTATTAAALTTARNIGGVSFNGSADINLPGVNAAGNQDTSGTAATASYVAFDDVVGLTATSASIAADIADLASGQYDLDFTGDTGGALKIENGETLTIAGGTNIGTVGSGNGLTVNLDANISLTSVTASVLGNVVGNVVGNLTGAVTGNASTATTTTGASTGQGKVTVGTNVDIDLGLQTTASPTFASLTLTGDLTVQGTTTELNTTNLNVEDQFILINSGAAAADGGLVVNGAGAAIGWDESEKRFALDFAGATFNQTAIGTDAFVAAVVTTDDANYRKVGNIRLDNEDIYIYS